MKEQNIIRMKCITILLFIILSVVLIVVGFSQEYRSSSLFSGGVGGLIVSLYMLKTIWSAKASQRKREQLIIDETDERNLLIQKNSRAQAFNVSLIATLAASVLASLYHEEAINSCFKILFGFDNLPVIYALFTILQVALAIKGFEGIKWLENISCIFIIAILAYMLYVVKTQFAAEIDDVFSGIKGTWGMPFWAATTSFLGIYSTMIINASDYSRNVKEKIGPVFTGSIYTVAILPVTLFMGLIGLLVTAATGNSDPVVVFSTTMGSKFLTVVTLLFIAFAQVTTNVLNNIVPPSYVLMESFRMKWSHATIVVGILSACCMPWKLVTDQSAAGLNLFTQFYSAFLGPIFAVMAVDYYILRKKKLDINNMYNKQGVFKGVNWAAIIAIIVGSLCSLIIVQLSWYVSLIPTGLVYYFLMKTMKSSAPFRTGTVFEK